MGGERERRGRQADGKWLKSVYVHVHVHDGIAANGLFT